MIKILIIEDDSLMTKMYETVFTSNQYEVVTASNGEEGFEKALSIIPTVILLDVMMPKLNGYQVLEKLKSNPQIQHIPVVMLSNLSGEQALDEALSKGATQFITKSNAKPHEIEEIVRKIVEEKKETPA